MARKASTASTDLLGKGSIVVFEGPSEVVCTQLRLLPASPHILVLPALQTYLPDNLSHHITTSDTYLRHIHNAAAARHDAAVDFIRAGSLEAKRLVFLNGGTARAYAMAIQFISDWDANGNVGMAEVHLREMLGSNPIPPMPLTMPPPPPPSLLALGLPSSESPEPELDDDCFGSTFEERMLNAMRAAEALDEKTSDLQSEPYSASSLRPRPRSMSLPVYGFTDRFGDLAAFYMFGSPLADLEPQEASEVYSRVSSVFPGAMPGPEMSPRGTSHLHERPLSPTETVSSDRSSCRDSCVSPTTPYPPPRRNKPLPTDNKSVADWAADLRTLLPLPAKAPQRARSLQFAPPQKASPKHKNNPPNTPPPKKEPIVSESSSSSLARAVDVTTRSASCIDMSPSTYLPKHDASPLLQLSPPELSEPSPPRFRACFTSSFGQHIQDTAAPVNRRDSRRESYREFHRESRRESAVAAARRESRRLSTMPTAPLPPPPPIPSVRNLLPFTEDMVVFFRDESHDSLLERVMSHFQTGSFPCTARFPDARRPSISRVVISRPARPASFFIPTPAMPHMLNDGARRASSSQVRLSQDGHEFGGSLQAPNASEVGDVSSSVALPISDQHLLSSFPPTPVHTPPIGPIGAAIPENLSSRFHVLPVSHAETAVTVQNALRAVLDKQFPRGEVGYQQFCPMLPELNGLWKPVFRETEGSDGGREKRKVDFIIALGAQNGVDKAFTGNISRRLEKLGTKPTGDSRSGRLDLRYLIVNAMQAFTSQRLLYQTEDNPFTNPYLLASLVIPHLETFLAAHTHIRYLLLEYPSDHLPTILAVQKMIGSSIMKVAQILDATDSEKAPFNPLPYRPPSPTSTSAYSTFVPSSDTPSTSALTRANLLLSSSATPSEIESFVAAVAAVLAAISPFYETLPDEDCPPLSPAGRTPIKGPFSPFPHRDSAQSTHIPLTPISSARGEGFKLSRPPKGRGILGEQPRNVSPISKILGDGVPIAIDNESVVEINVSEWADGEDDIGLEADERRLVPMFMRKRSPRLTPNSKAMRFLGLA